MAWVAAAEREDRFRSRIIANRNVGVRLLATTDNKAAVADRLYPTLLTRDGYVYLDGQVTGKGRSTIFYTGDLLTYALPDEGARAAQRPRLQLPAQPDLPMRHALATSSARRGRTRCWSTPH